MDIDAKEVDTTDKTNADATTDTSTADPSTTNGNKDKVDEKIENNESTDENEAKKRKIDVSSTSNNSTTSLNNNNNNNTSPPNNNENNTNNNKNNNPTKKKRAKKKHIDPKVIETRRAIQQCCATNNLSLALEHYNKALLGDIQIEAQTFYNLLNLCDGLAGGSRNRKGKNVHVGTPKSSKVEKEDPKDEKEEEKIVEVSRAERSAQAFKIKSYMDTHSIPLNETAYTALIRILSKSFDYTKASEILTQAESTQQCNVKLRLYSPLLHAYTIQNDIKGALGVWSRLHLIKLHEKEEGERLKLTEREYNWLLECAVRCRNVKVMTRVLSDLAEDVLVPGVDTTKVILSWFEQENELMMKKEDGDGKVEEMKIENENEEMKEAKENENGDDPKITPAPITDDEMDQIILPPNIAPSMGPLQSPTSTTASSQNYKWMISKSCYVNTKTGTLTTGCFTNYTLKPAILSSQAWNEMYTMNESIVLEGSLEQHKDCPYQGGGKGKKRTVNGKNKQNNGNGGGDRLERRKMVWNDFNQFLNYCLGKNENDVGTKDEEMKDVKQDNENDSNDKVNKVNNDDTKKVNDDKVNNNDDKKVIDEKADNNDDKKVINEKADNNGDKKVIDEKADDKKVIDEKSDNSDDKKDIDDKVSNNNNNDDTKKDDTPTTTKKGYDVVIDGANVGYYETNFKNAPKHVDYNQIDWMIRHFAEYNNQTVLLILHERHFSHKLMPHWAKRIVQGWHEDDNILLYKTPFGCNDDWFWMHAALVHRGTMVITNDEMRDHHFQMLAHRSFLRWKERHRVTFTFGDWERNRDKNGRRRRIVELSYPDPYSRRIQRVEDYVPNKEGEGKEEEEGGIVIPLPKYGDEDRFADGVHVANDDATPKEETYVCIRLTCCSDAE